MAARGSRAMTERTAAPAICAVCRLGRASSFSRIWSIASPSSASLACPVDIRRETATVGRAGHPGRCQVRTISKAAALAALAVPAMALADTVRLRTGDVVEGDVKDLGDRIQVAAAGGPVSLRWTDVDVVLRDKTAKDLYAEKRAALAKDDAKGLYALALWAERAGLADERRTCLGEVLAADPDHAAARAALSQQKADGKWLQGPALLEAKG